MANINYQDEQVEREITAAPETLHSAMVDFAMAGAMGILDDSWRESLVMGLVLPLAVLEVSAEEYTENYNQVMERLIPLREQLAQKSTPSVA